MKYCSFCGKNKRDSKYFLLGAGDVIICDSCLEIGLEEVNHQKNQNNKQRFKTNLTPKKIKKKLDEYVVGQTVAKKVLSVAVYNHYKRINNTDEFENVELDKNNILLVGPTGVGKTLLAKTLAKIIDVPFAMADATTFTETGYVGDDVESVLTRLLENARGDLEAAKRGIIYIDEIDKIAKRFGSLPSYRDVGGEGVQQALLKLIEGTEANVPLNLGRKHPNNETVVLDTTNILFIVGGAFPNIDSIVEKRFNKKDIGFDLNAEQKILSKKQVYENITAEDLIEFGLIPEFMGRVSNVAPLVPLTQKDMLHILTEPKNALIKQYETLFAMDNVELKFEPEALDAIAEITIKRDLGARGLNSILENSMKDLMFNVPGDKKIKSIVIDKDVINKHSKPQIKYHNVKKPMKKKKAC